MINENKIKKEKKRRQKTFKKNTLTNDFPISTDSFIVKSRKHKKEPPWGCLKGGGKPTYKEWKNTLKKNTSSEKINIPKMDNPTNEILQRQAKLNRIKEKITSFKSVDDIKKTKLIHVNRTLKIHKLGKKNNKVGVLIKSGKTRKNIKNEVMILKKKAITEIKRYLRKHNLIKVGSVAPENILRRLYEDSYLAGDIYNNNTETLIHNYINK